MAYAIAELLVEWAPLSEMLLIKAIEFPKTLPRQGLSNHSLAIITGYGRPVRLWISLHVAAVSWGYTI